MFRRNRPRIFRHFIMLPHARLKRKSRLQRSQFRTHHFDFGSKLTFKHIAGKLVFTVNHPHAVFLAHRQGRNPLRELPGRQNIVKSAEALRPKFC